MFRGIRGTTFTKTILISSQVENLAAYHLYTISVLDFYLDLMRACDNCHLNGPVSEKQRQIIKHDDAQRTNTLRLRRGA